MGYRSDVAAVFYVSKVEHFPLIKLWLQENFPMDTFHDYIRWFDRGMVFEEDGTKWYDDYDEVKAFNEAERKFLELVRMGAPNSGDAPVFAYEFMRIGENYDDIEDLQDGVECEYLLNVTRTITVDTQEVT